MLKKLGIIVVVLVLTLGVVWYQVNGINQSSNTSFNTSPNQVGTKVLSLDVAGFRGGPSRPVAIQLWYPTAKSGDITAPYFVDQGVLEAVIEEGYYFQTKENLTKWGSLTVNATLGATPLNDAHKYPVLFLSPGLGVIKQNYGLMAAKLARWGYIVVTVDHAYNGPMRTKAGEIISYNDDPNTGEPDFDLETEKRAHDLIEIVNAFKNGTTPEIKAIIDGMDFDKIGALGHSLGGLVAFEACSIDARFKACVNLDGAPQGTFPKNGIGKPAMMLASNPRYSREELIAKGRDPDTWGKGDGFRQQWLDIYALRSDAKGYQYTVDGTGHMSFSDAAFVMPDTITRFGGDLTDFNEVSNALNVAMRRFFDAYLKEQGTFGDGSLEDLKIIHE